MDRTSAADSRRNWGTSFTMWAAIIVVLHPLSIGPLVYLEARGWLNAAPFQPVFQVMYAPEIYIVWHRPPFLAEAAEAYRGYITWWENLGKAHTTAAP